jgi:hypothetical protein
MRHFGTQYCDETIKRHFCQNIVVLFRNLLKLTELNIFNLHGGKKSWLKIFFYRNIECQNGSVNRA